MPLRSARFDRNTQSFRGLTHALVQTQQPDADDRGSRDEKRCEMDGIECPDRITWKRPARPIDYLVRNSQHLPVRSSLDEVRSTVCGFGFRQLLDHHRAEQQPITLDQGQVRRDNDFGFAKQPAHCGCSGFVEEPSQHRTRLRVEIHRVPRSSSSNWATILRRSPRLRGSEG